MRALTHWVGGLAAGVAAAGLWPAHAGWVVAAACLAGPLPDVDHPGSVYGRWVPLPRVARVAGRVVPYRRDVPAFGQVGFRTPWGIVWHRGACHSVGAVGLMAAGAGLLVARVAPEAAAAVATGVAAGAASHLALDSLNRMGQALGWPWTRRRFRAPWSRWPVDSGVDTVVLLGLAGWLAWHGGVFLPLAAGR
jgi:inner membrane protein